MQIDDKAEIKHLQRDISGKILKAGFGIDLRAYKWKNCI